MYLDEISQEENARLLKEWEEGQRIRQMRANIPKASVAFFEECMMKRKLKKFQTSRDCQSTK